MGNLDRVRIHLRVEKDARVHHAERVVMVQDMKYARADLEAVTAEIVAEVLDSAAPRLSPQAEWEHARRQEVMDEHRPNR